jgi:hypothetical protein
MAQQWQPPPRPQHQIPMGGKPVLGCGGAARPRPSQEPSQSQPSLHETSPPSMPNPPKTTTPAAPSTDPRFRTCSAANAAGYGPYYRG